MPFPALAWGGLGVPAFSLTLPATRGALPAFGPATLGIGRAVPAAVASAAVAYAEGGALAREMPGWQVISWALILGMPVVLPLALAGLVAHPPAVPSAGAWLGAATQRTRGRPPAARAEPVAVGVPA